MAAYDLEEQEQLSAIKAWWEQNGNMVSWIVTVIAVCAAGWFGWQRYQLSQAAEAGVLYSAVLDSAEKSEAPKVRAAASDLVSKFPGKMSADLGVMFAGKSEADAGDTKSAILKLQWVVDNTKDAALRDMARLRLAAYQIDDKAFDAALKTLEAAPTEAFLPRVEDMRGDVYFAKGAVKESAAAYQRALDAYAKAPTGTFGAGFKGIVETKLEALGGV
ncbi:YfgM family protein [Uliginosibacterium gangwonense]|uniref:YfgM family protein n=1 Tax=Uliginosibacterium gangwonense TaxID=392736 RepID=UPI00035EB590|nr:tetratricopeptide repeat protein [Uliginosibacterium gangwonense]